MNRLLFSEGFPAPPTQRCLVQMKGKDSKDFLHRLTTANTHALQPGTCVPACFLNPAGKIESFFLLGCETPDHYWLDLECTEGKPERAHLLALLDRYIFAEKIEILGTENGWAHAWELDVSPSGAFVSSADCLRFTHGTRQSVWTTASRLKEWGARAPLTGEMEAYRVEQLIPARGHEIDGEGSPLEVGLADAVAPSKGCYPGQEVIEKIISLGSPAKRLVQIECHGSIEAGEIQDLATGSSIGKITTFTNAPNGSKALGIVRKTHIQKDLEVVLKTSTQRIHGRIKAVAPFQTP